MKAGDKAEFTRLLLRDFHALEAMIRNGGFEQGVSRFGYELELNLVDHDGTPAFIGCDIAKKLARPDFTPEFSRFNLEINSVPVQLGGDCFQALQRELGAALDAIRGEAAKQNCTVLLTGIIPTLNKSHITREALTPEPRYELLYDIRRVMKGEQYEYRIQGVDELLTRDNIALFAGCVTSFQTHLQVDAADLADHYNWAQLLAGPLLATATNSPLFLGKRLWQETRIELFEQATDTRNPEAELSRNQPRVFFGERWIQDSVLELLQEDIINFDALLTRDEVEDPDVALAEGRPPALQAWTLFNGSIYRWNRVCYGIHAGKAALRIENRVLPSGPTLPDMVANAAFWTGAMLGLNRQYRQLRDKLEFALVKENFFKAARYGLDVEFSWPGGPVSARELVLDELLPLAHRGLEAAGIDKRDVLRYLRIIRERTETGRTGSWWMLNAYRQLRETQKRDQALQTLTVGMLARQDSGLPVHRWEPVAPAETAGTWSSQFSPVHKFMTTPLYKVHVDDVVDLVVHLMEWKRIGHIPVEDDKGLLAGLITRNTIINFMLAAKRGDAPVHADELMIAQPLSVSPDTSLQTAIRLMLDNQVSCLPVVSDKRIVGLVTEHDMVRVAQGLVAALEAAPGDKHADGNDAGTRVASASVDTPPLANDVDGDGNPEAKSALQSGAAAGPHVLAR